MRYLRWLGEALIVAMTLLCLTAALGLLSGCASQVEVQTLADAQVKVVEAQSEMGQDEAAVIECGPKGCPGLKVTINRPRAAIIVPEVKGSNDVAISAIKPVLQTVTTLGVTFGVIRGFKAVMDNIGTGNTTTHTNNITNGDGNTNTASSTLEKTDTTSAVGDTRTVDSHNITDSYNPIDDNSAVSVPTVVAQPEPVIVKPQVVRP